MVETAVAVFLNNSGEGNGGVDHNRACPLAVSLSQSICPLQTLTLSLSLSSFP